MRAVALCILVAALASACTLVEPAPPAGTRQVHARVSNMQPDPVELTVTTPAAGVLPGAVQPTSRLEGSSTTDVTFYVPLEGAWTIARNGNQMITSDDLNPKLDPGCTLRISFRPTGWGWGCGNDL